MGSAARRLLLFGSRRILTFLLYAHRWGWNNGKGLGAIFAGLGMAPAIAAGFGAVIFSLIRLVVHMRRNPIPWAVYTSPFWFLVAGTICTLSVVYKGSPKLGLNKKPSWYVASVTLGTGSGLALLALLFFVPYAHAKIIKKDPSVKGWMFIMGPALFMRPAPSNNDDRSVVPNYAVVQDDHHDAKSLSPSDSNDDHALKDKEAAIESPAPEAQLMYRSKLAESQESHHAYLRTLRGPMGWAMRHLHNNPMGQGEIYEAHNMRTLLSRVPAQIVVGACYGFYYDIHSSQSGVKGTPEGDRMARVYAQAKKYPNEVEHCYSFVQVLTACTASFAHGANDIGNSVGPWAVIYSAWRTGDPVGSKAPVPVWQLAVLSACISVGLVTYGYNIMKVMGNKLTYHSPSRGCSMELGAAITVLLFSQFALPVSTSMYVRPPRLLILLGRRADVDSLAVFRCITGATVGVGLINGTGIKFLNFRAVNWQRVGLLVFSWIMTIPIAGTRTSSCCACRTQSFGS